METKRFDAAALGELLIDYTENSLSGQKYQHCYNLFKVKIQIIAAFL